MFSGPIFAESILLIGFLKIVYLRILENLPVEDRLKGLEKGEIKAVPRWFEGLVRSLSFGTGSVLRNVASKKGRWKFMDRDRKGLNKQCMSTEAQVLRTIGGTTSGADPRRSSSGREKKTSL